MSMDRRHFLRSLFVLTPIAAALSACGKEAGWPAGMQPIKWDRDTCVVCNMVISDRRFAAEMRGGPKSTIFKFDDPGCIALWLHDKTASYPWMHEPATQIWVADVGSHGDTVRWLEARKVHYVAKFSPMGYNFGAAAQPQAGAVDFATMSEHVVALVRKAK
jgi:nitrous oxide reductase accessory protein NosL